MMQEPMTTKGRQKPPASYMKAPRTGPRVRPRLKLASHHALTLAFCSGNLAIKIERLVFTVHVYCILYMCTVPGHQDREVSVPSGSGPHPLNDPDEVGEHKEGAGVLDPVQEPKHDEAQAVEDEASRIEDARSPDGQIFTYERPWEVS